LTYLKFFFNILICFCILISFRLWRHAPIMLEAIGRPQKPCLGKSVRQRSYVIDLERLKCQSLSLREHMSRNRRRLRYRRRHCHNLKIYILVEIISLICITCFFSLFSFFIFHLLVVEWKFCLRTIFSNYKTKVQNDKNKTN